MPTRRVPGKEQGPNNDRCDPALVGLTGGAATEGAAGTEGLAHSVPGLPHTRATAVRSKCPDVTLCVSPFSLQARGTRQATAPQPHRRLGGRFRHMASRLAGGCSDREAPPRSPPERRRHRDLTLAWPCAYPSSQVACAARSGPRLQG